MGKRVMLLVLLAVSVFAAVGVGSARALNPQPLPPRVAGVVTDACTGLPVAGATVALTALSGERNPGPGGTGLLGGFLLPVVQAGQYALSVAAPGYDPVGKDPGPPGLPDGSLTVTLDPQPQGLPAGEAVNETELVAVALAPASPGAFCARNPGPPGLPDLAGMVRNAATGRPVASAQETLTPTSGERDPGPPGFNAFGLFAWPTLDPGSYALSISAPGFLGIGLDPAAANPVMVSKDPGPPGFTDGSSVAFRKTFDVWLTPSG